MSLIEPVSVAPEELVKRLWWLTLTRGIFAIALGLFALFVPGWTVSALFMLFGVFTLADGIVALGIGIFAPRTVWGSSVFQGIAGIVIGLLVLRYPQTVAAIVVVIFAIWALVIGLFQIVLAFRLRANGGHWLWVLVSGLVTAFLGIYFLVNPDTGVAVLAITIGIFALIAGAVLIFGAVQVRRFHDELKVLRVDG
ncbi:MAG TPA: DUF308 domain-containing protein [Propionicimonas sp.]|nr:DUF308 domain-containing protein [Propionicimonas sp.]HQA78618.1 DUF308 domain-containing protein [Propionicimonas sp.]HQD97369.1 DUF308 domain-containing protein [Propionicimonas sp.]